MAKDGKGGGPSELRRQLGSLLKSTWHQLDAAREVVVQKSRAGRIQLDLTLLRRKRRRALADLGEVVVRAAAEGRIDEEDFPELSGPLSRLEALDEQIADQEQQLYGRAPAGAPQDDDREEYDADDDDRDA